VATPFAKGVRVEQPGIAAEVTLSLKVTFPDRATPPAGADTVAERATGWLNEEGFGAALTAIVVVAGESVTGVESVAFAMPKFLSPV
jgi:hypothetical protein